MTLGDRMKSAVADVLVKVMTRATYKLTDPIIGKIFGVAKRGRLESAYKQIPVVYGCVNAKMRNIAQVPFRIYSLRDEKRPLESGGIVDLFNEINPYMDRYEFFEALVNGLEMNGNFYVYPDRSRDRNGIPAYLWVLFPQWVKEAFDTNRNFVGWRYSRSGRGDENFYRLGELVHSKYYNPDSEYRGLAPLEAAKMNVDLKWNALRYSEAFFRNDATPPFVVESERPIPDPLRSRLKQELFEERRGVEKAHLGLLLDGGMKAKTLGVSQKDIQLLESLKMTDEQVMMVFKVPKSELSLYENINYATALSQDRGFWLKTLLPLMRKIQDALNKGLLVPLGFRGKFDLSAIEALNEIVGERVDAARKLWEMGFTANELNERFQFGFEPAPWRDEPKPPGGGLMGLKMRGLIEEVVRATIVAGQAALPIIGRAENVPLPPPEKPAEEDLLKKLEDEKAEQINRTLLPLQAQAASAVRKYFLELEQKLLKKLVEREGRKAKALKVGLGARALEDWAWLDEIIAQGYDSDKFARAVQEYVEEAVKRGGQGISSTFDIEDESAKYWIGLRVAKVKGVLDTSQGDLLGRLRIAIKDSIGAGNSEEQTAQIVMDTIAGSLECDRRRAKTIARTEVHGSFSDGRWQAMTETDPDAKKWITSIDEKVRETHRENGERGAVPFDATFHGDMQRPHDPEGPAGEVINCRCKLVALYGQERALRMGPWASGAWFENGGARQWAVLV